ncbi:hypothetical protein EV192_110275 [Actinocrispum wychmicini]|uniref:Uncharacterized protein n=1 Tax=Actinocrispum wychmicini TaxID=1213861 RepID=A0A4R2JHT4_9PSEU|nr:hypothetical protein EV192_110275 [Actinocrispum wychmicini]
MTGAVVTHPNHTGRARVLAGGTLDVVTDRTSAAWLSIPDGSTHHFLLPDNAVTSTTFFERVQNAAKTMPDAALVLFTAANTRNGAAVRQGALAGARWVPAASEYVPTAGTVLPHEVARGFVGYVREHGGHWPESVLLHRFLKRERVPAFLAVPNLVDYSLAENNSACFFGEDPEAGDEPGLAELSVVPFYAHGFAQCAVRMSDGWRTMLTDEYLRRFAIPDLPTAADFDSAEERAVWLTGFTMGVVNRFEGHGVSRSGLVLDRALSTLGSSRRLHAFAWDGLRSGMGTAPKSSDRPLSVRVAVDGYLGEYLLFTLAGRGYPVTRDSPADVVVYDGDQPARGAKATIRLGGDEPLPGVSVIRTDTPYGPGMPGEPSRADRLVHIADIADAVEQVMLRDPPPALYPIDRPSVPVDFGLHMLWEWRAYETDE